MRASVTMPHRQMALVGLGVLAVSMVSHFRVPLLPDVGRDLSLSAAQLGLITTSFAAGRLATDLPAGRLVDRLGVRRLFVVAGVAVCVGGATFAGATGRTWVLVAAFVLGMASALANTTGMTYFSTVAPVERRGASMSVFSASLLGGQALGPMVGGAIAGWGSWRTAMLVSAALGGVVAVAGVAGRRSGRERGSTRAPVVSPELVSAGAAAAGRLRAAHRFALYAIPFTMMFTIGSLQQTLVPIIGSAAFGLTSASIGLALGVGAVCRMVGSPVGGWLSDRISRKGVLVPALVCQGIGVVVLAFAVNVPLWLLSIVLMSLSSFGGVIAATILGDLGGGARMGRRLGGYRFVGDVGLVVGPAVTGAVFERLGQVPAVLIVAGMLLAVAVVVAVVLPETRWIAEPHGGPG